MDEVLGNNLTFTTTLFGICGTYLLFFFSYWSERKPAVLENFLASQWRPGVDPEF